MSDQLSPVQSVALPLEAAVIGLYPATDLADAYSIRLSDDAPRDPEVLARFMFAQQAPWVSGLMRARDTLMAGFGVKTTKNMRISSDAQRDKRVGIFRVYAKTSHEILLGEDDRHLDFRISVLLRMEASASAPDLIVSTVVHCHNRLGRNYLRLIAPFHRLIVQATLRRAARTGWPKAATQSVISM